MKKTRIVSLLVVVSLMLCACGGSKETNTNKDATNKNAVFKEEANAFQIEEGEISQLVVCDDTVYVEQHIYDYDMPIARTVGMEAASVSLVAEEEIAEEAAAEEVITEDEFIEEMPATTRKITVLSLDGTVKSQFTQELGQNYGSGNFTADTQGNIYSILYQYATYVGDDVTDKIFLIAQAADGTENWRIHLNESLEEDGYFYVRSIYCNEDNQIILETSRGIEIYDVQGNPVKMIERQELSESGLYQIREGKYAVATSDGSAAYIQTLDMQSGSFGEKVTLPFNYYRYQINSGKVYDLCLSDEYGIYGYNIGDAEITKVMDYISSDFATNYLYNVFFIDENTFVAYYYDDNGAILSRFTKVAPEDVSDKAELLVGCYYLDSQVKQQVIEFNKENQEYRLNIRDYSMYDTMDDYSQGLTRLNTDIVSGDVPDILILNSQMPFNSYSAKGVFADMNTFLEKDTQLKKEDLLPNILEALSTDGQLYRIAPSFSVTTFVGKTADVGAEPGWTMDEALALLASKPEGTQLLSEMTSSTFLYYLSWICGEQYVNWDTGECFFDSDGFIKALEYAKTLPKEIDYTTITDDESYWQEMEAQYRNGKTLLSIQYLSGFRDYNYAKQGVFGEDITLVGFPVDEGQGAGLSFSISMAISALSEHQDIAWEFVKTFFTEEYQDALEYDFPTKISSLKKLEEKAWEKPFFIDEDGNKHEYDDYFYVNGLEIPVEPMTAEETAVLVDYLKSLDKLCIYDETLYNIIEEEAAGYFEGQKSAKEVADIIQSRAKIYVNENS